MSVDHRAAQQRYLFSVDVSSSDHAPGSSGVEEQVGLTDYVVRGDAIHLTHTEISPRLRGNGLGARMVQEVLDLIRAETTYRVVPDCPFVADWLDAHPEYRELTTRGL